MKFLLIVVCSLLLFSCNEQQRKNEEQPLLPSNDTALKEASSDDSSMLASTAAARADTSLAEVIDAVLTAMQQKDFEKLAHYFHPVQGVRFSPYGYIDTSSDQHFSGQDFVKAMADIKPRQWGNYSGSGKPIILTPQKYFDLFVYDKDYKQAPEVGLDRLVSKGNSVNNLRTIYANSIFTELYFPGQEKYNGMDWKSLKLVFLRHKGKPYLVGVVHDEWTI